MPITERAGPERRWSRGRRETVLAAVTVAAAALSGCAPQAAPPPQVAPHRSTWRVVVWGASDDIDAAARTAIEAELLRRGIATAIVPQAGFVDHILDVSITPEAMPLHKSAHTRKAAAGQKPSLPAPPPPLVADETVSEGRDQALAPERSFHTAEHPADLPPLLANDPVRALAFTIGETLAPASSAAPATAPVPAGSPAKPSGARTAH